MDIFEPLDVAIKAASPTERAGLVVQLSARLAALGAGLAASVEPAPTRDTSLTIKEGARRLGVSTAYLYRNLKALPFACRIGRRVVLSERGIERYLERQRKP